MDNQDLRKIQDRIGYEFKNFDLLEQAFVRKSYAREKGGEHKGFRSKGQKLTNGWKPVRGKQKSDHRMRWSDFCCETNTTGSAGSSKILSLIQKS